MKLIRRLSDAPDTPLGDGEVDRDNCDCRCEYDHCQDCAACTRRNSGQCDACDSGECNCNDCDCDCDDYCTCESEEGGLWNHDKDVLRVFNARVEHDIENDDGTVLLGAEVELEIPDDCRTSKAHEALCSAFNDAPLFIGKEDGSLNDGIEVVSLPLTLEEQAGLAKALEAHWMPVMEKSSRTGMHVHIGKAALEDSAHQEAFANFFSGHGGNADWGLFLDRLFRRSQNTYCERKASGRELRSNGKYSSVNFSKQYTLEVRGFASVKSAKTYMANLELVLAVRDATMFALRGSTRPPAYSPRAFMQFVSEREGSYPNLADRLRLTHNDAGNELFAPWIGEPREIERPDVYLGEIAEVIDEYPMRRPEGVDCNTPDCDACRRILGLQEAVVCV